MPITQTSSNPADIGTHCFTWCDEKEPICWDSNLFCWDDVCLVTELISAVEEGSGGDLLNVYNEWEEEKKKRFITLYCKVKDQTDDIYSDVGDTTTEVRDDIIITAKEIRMVVEAVLPPRVNVLIETKDV